MRQNDPLLFFPFRATETSARFPPSLFRYAAPRKARSVFVPPLPHYPQRVAEETHLFLFRLQHDATIFFAFAHGVRSIRRAGESSCLEFLLLLSPELMVGSKISPPPPLRQDLLLLGWVEERRPSLLLPSPFCGTRSIANFFSYQQCLF